MKKIINLITIGTIAIVLAACSDDDKKVATVNDTVITQAQLNEALMSQYGEQVLDNLMSNEIIKQEAEKQKVTVSEEDVESEYNAYVESYGDEDTFIEAMQAYNMDKEAIQEEIQNYLLTYALISKDIELTDEDIQNYYDENAVNYTDEAGNQQALEDIKDEVTAALMSEQVDASYDQWLDEKFEEYDVKTYTK